VGRILRVWSSLWEMRAALSLPGLRAPTSLSVFRSLSRSDSNLKDSYLMFARVRAMCMPQQFAAPDTGPWKRLDSGDAAPEGMAVLLDRLSLTGKFELEA